MIKLTPRLMLVADMVNKCEKFVDIGTDHAYLPAFLVENNVTQTAIASDINPNPLKNAQQTLQEEELEEKISLRLSAGFENIRPDEAQEIAIAGMGGIMIAEMIDNTKWLKDNSKHLVLQPMTHFVDVRTALNKNGFEIEKEETVSEASRIYLVISARYTGNLNEKPLHWYYVGNLIYSEKNTDRQFVSKIYKSLKRKYDGLMKSGQNDIQTSEILRSIENAKSN